MKRYNLIIAAALLSFFMNLTTGCSDFLDKEPDDQLTLEMVFADKVRTEDWLASVYSSIPSPMWGYFKDEGYNIMGDDITIPQDWSPYGWANVYAYTTANWSPISSWNPNYWVELPKRIRTGLVFLENVRVIPNIGLTEAYVEQMKNEVRFLIAYYYSLLIELYGPIPFTPGVIFPVDAPTSELMTPQVPYDEIVDWIDKELKEVSTKLPAVYPSNNDWGRATSVMALAIRANTLLYAASPLFNGNPDLKDWKNSDGESLFSANADPQKWKKAADAYKELVTAAEAAGYGLYYEYNTDGTIDPFMSCYNMSLKRFSDGNKEIIFGKPYNTDVNWWQAHHLPKGIGGNAAMGTTQELVDAFFMKNGIAPITGYNEDGSPIINPESGYVEKGFSTAVESRHTKWPGGGSTSLADKTTGMSPVTLDGTYNMYCNREPRFYVSVIFNEAWLGVANRRVNFLQGGQDTDMTFDSPQNGYNVRKGVSLDINPKENKYTYQPGILYRMADAYLGYAEALNESLDEPNDEVYLYVNKIRERAGIPNLKTGLGKEQMRAAIQQERRVEFNCEGVRFNDVRRWKLGEKYLNNKLYGMNHDGSVKNDDVNDPKAFYKRKFYKGRYFNKRMYLWPVPQTQMDINPKLRQAPGY
ncbi:RagB/SusD family nutrient uptake outer membrane protein [Bacteroidaceae bacterium HV4-6-C5C]|nr:RagB/SusD family nutrient uptake outer membrane protein [Bacteroidaceae bacterium HV4-6-C5C]